MLWAAICILQAYFTELHPDEAYYWVYSQNIDWGHFHQPPMIALFIKMGYSIFENEFGVRLLTILANLATIKLLYGLCKPNKPWVFWVLMSSLFLMHAHSLLAVPDSPLIFFCVLFLWYYKKHNTALNLRHSTVLGLIALAIIYSKYHGGLFLFILLLSDLKILKNKWFYLIPIICVAGYIPHILWQINHDWAAIRFHLFNRESGAWEIMWVLEFIGAQLSLLLPLGVFLLPSLFKKPQQEFDVVMRRLVLGIFGFLLLLSFRNRVEANWIAMAYIPLIILAYPQIEKIKPSVIKGFGTVALLLFSIIRVELGSKLIGPPVNLNFRYQYYEAWADAIKKKAGDRPVVFMNSYQTPSIYSFYTGDASHSINTCLSPGNQYDFYGSSQFDGKDVIVINGFKEMFVDSVVVQGEPIALGIIEDYRSFQGIWLTPSLEDNYPANSEEELNVAINNRLDYTPDFSPRRNGNEPIIAYNWIDEQGNMEVKFSFTVLRQEDVDTSIKLRFKTPDKPGKYKLAIGISSYTYYPIRNSYFYTVEIK